ncbi:GNAT family N-acetyltransferase [Kitasatospora purpeofusca]|uniref:GNAT family N-acetyltransferase n=1 Tax=Kitasatospora purpeofusca TaxID=67352 RepID=UPI00099D70E2|nr:GNAT family N-acetyltransferase [Kitasatospora purpeofusca]
MSTEHPPPAAPPAPLPASSLSAAPSAAPSALRLEPVTPSNIDAALELKVRPDQERFVSPVVKSLAEAYAYGDTAWPRLVYDGDRPVGFVMAFFDITFYPDRPGDLPRSGLWRLNIAAGTQGRGYGRFAVEQVAAEIRRRGGSRVTVTYVPGEDGPEPFYARLGFRPTGELSGDQTVAELDLS